VVGLHSAAHHARSHPCVRAVHGRPPRAAQTRARALGPIVSDVQGAKTRKGQCHVCSVPVCGRSGRVVKGEATGATYSAPWSEPQRAAARYRSHAARPNSLCILRHGAGAGAARASSCAPSPPLLGHMHAPWGAPPSTIASPCTGRKVGTACGKASSVVACGNEFTSCQLLQKQAEERMDRHAPMPAT
jgi:hypothetical protein